MKNFLLALCLCLVLILKAKALDSVPFSQNTPGGGDGDGCRIYAQFTASADGYYQLFLGRNGWGWLVTGGSVFLHSGESTSIFMDQHYDYVNSNTFNAQVYGTGGVINSLSAGSIITIPYVGKSSYTFDLTLPHSGPQPLHLSLSNTSSLAFTVRLLNPSGASVLSVTCPGGVTNRDYTPPDSPVTGQYSVSVSYSGSSVGVFPCSVLSASSSGSYSYVWSVNPVSFSFGAPSQLPSKNPAGGGGTITNKTGSSVSLQWRGPDGSLIGSPFTVPAGGSVNLSDVLPSTFPGSQTGNYSLVNSSGAVVGSVPLNPGMYDVVHEQMGNPSWGNGFNYTFQPDASGQTQSTGTTSTTSGTTTTTSTSSRTTTGVSTPSDVYAAVKSALEDSTENVFSAPAPPYASKTIESGSGDSTLQSSLSNFSSSLSQLSDAWSGFVSRCKPDVPSSVGDSDASCRFTLPLLLGENSYDFTVDLTAFDGWRVIFRNLEVWGIVALTSWRLMNIFRESAS